MRERIRFYLDERVPEAVARGLRARGIAQGAEHCGIAYLPQQRRVSIGEVIDSLCLVHDVLTPEEMKNRIEYL